MINSCISKEEKVILKSLIGKKLDCIKSEQKDSWNRIFGNLAIITKDFEIEIRNELTETEYFGDIEDISKFKIRFISQENPFVLMVEAPIIETVVSEIIKDIIIVQDDVSVNDNNGKTIYNITMDQAIIIKTSNSFYVISREWSLEEELIFLKSANYKNSVYSVNDVISEWSDEDDGTVAVCKRTEISLKI